MAKTVKNPFNPGTATQPVHVAGRLKERAFIEETLLGVTDLDPDDETQPGPLVPLKIVGPRGVGKTTLLLEAEKQAKSLKIQVLHLVELNSLADHNLVAGLVGEKAHDRLLNKLSRVKGISAGPVGIAWEPEQVGLEQSFRKKMAEQPLLLLLDEVMHYEPKALSGLLRVCQRLISIRQPLAVIMAGTPQTDQMLGQLKASFIERVNKIYINAFDDDETLDALAHPFKLHKAKVAPAALRRMKKLTDNYPFFIQIVGCEVWKAMSATGKREVSLALVKQAEPAIKEKRESFYEEIHAKIISASLLKHAERAMEILGKNQGKVKRVAMISGLAGKKLNVYSPEHVEIFDQLLDRGFIWMRRGWVEAGIPSFFDFCRQTAKAAKQTTF